MTLDLQCDLCLWETSESHFLRITSSHECKRKKNMRKTKGWHYRTKTFQIANMPHNNLVLYSAFFPSSSPHFPLPCQMQGKDMITGIFAFLLLPDKTELQLAQPSCKRLFTCRQGDKEVGTIWPLWETNPKNSYDMYSRCSLCPLSFCAWCEVYWNRGLFFFLFDGSLGKPVYLLHFCVL